MSWVEIISLLFVYCFPRLLRRTVWKLQYSQLVRGNLIANQLMTLFPPAERVHIAALPLKQVSSVLSSSSPLVFLQFDHFASAFREQASHCLQGHGVRAGPWWLNCAEVTGWWPEIKGGHRGAAQKGGAVCSRWIRLNQKPASGWGLRLHQERDGLRQVPGYAHLSPCTLTNN